MKNQENRKTQRNHLPHYGRRVLGMVGGTCCFGAQALMMTYMSFYLTDSVMMSVMTVALIISCSRVFDGISDLIAGFIIDRTNTRWGKGRPYALMYAVTWVATILVFSVPEIGNTGKIIYVFLMYNLSETVFRTLATAAGTVQTKLAFTSDEQVDMVGVTGIVAGIVNMILAIIMPTLIENVGTDRAGWTLIALCIGIPSGVMGLLQFFLVPERDIYHAKEYTVKEKMTVRESVRLLFKNPYIFIYLVPSLTGNIIAGMTVGTYYFKYIMGDISLQTIVAMFALVGLAVMPFIPPLTRKLGVKRFVVLFLMIRIAGYMLVYLSPTNMMILSASQILTLLGSLPLSMLGTVLSIQCMKYTEWREGKKIDGLISSVSSMSIKAGNAIGALIVGALLGMANYDGNLAVQTVAVNNTIIFLYAGMPALLSMIGCIGMACYGLEKRMPLIEKELEERYGKDDGNL